jgi:hypothetical protein
LRLPSFDGWWRYAPRISSILDPYGTISTLVGTGKPGFCGDGGRAPYASMNATSGLAVDSAGDLYVYDTLNRRIRQISHPAG